MKKSFYGFAIIVLFVGLAACSSKKESAASIAQEWCDLNGKAYKAAEGPEKEAAEAARKKFEDNMESKYKDDKAFMEEIGKEVEKCEDASEGR
ncbi:hypothetical protein CAP36_04415 [Chitinophagaceae bacterium IBVUCB2]|nr:hypothetical protein CAP36_04415 [Chitinophagaceae bacterium IBVUCB2]